MPTKTPEDEKKWQKAKSIAKEQGKDEDYAYIMGIYKKMKPDYEFKTASERVARQWMRRVAEDTAEEAYRKRMAEIDALLVSIRRKLKQDVILFKRDPKNWGFVGSLGHVRELLNEIDAFM